MIQEEFTPQARQFPHFREFSRVLGQNSQEAQEWQHHYGVLSKVH